MIAQHEHARILANETRVARARIRHQVNDGSISVLQAVNDPSCATATVATVLSWQRRWLDLRAERFLMSTGVCSPFCLARDLTDRQRHMLAKALGVQVHDDGQKRAPVPLTGLEKPHG